MFGWLQHLLPVGVISFIGLIAPNTARHLGFLKAKSELIAAAY
ncbi:hypothetical protein O9992_30475 [Vibrio lentus]|nr:hypothetical protein [Vibrio lentus]